MSSDDELKFNFNTRKKQLVTNTSEVIILRGDFKKIVNRATKDLKNDNIFHACPDDLKYFEKCINDNYIKKFEEVKVDNLSYSDSL